MSKRLVFDTETTGFLLPSTAELKDQPHIIEIGLIIVTPKCRHPDCDCGVQGCNDKSLLTTEKSWLLNPVQPLTDEITKITGLKDDDLRGKPTFIEVLPELIECFLGARELIAHNMPFDLGMLLVELRRIGKETAFPFPPEQLCTVSSYSHLKGHNMKLVDLYKHVMGVELKQTHRALDDARALLQILIKEGIIS